MRKLDLYKILGVNPNCSTLEIKKAYKKLVLKYHPDKNKADNSNEKFIEIKYAYDILSNDKSRTEYDLNNLDNKFSGPSEYDYKIFNFLNTNLFLSYLKSVTTDKNYLNLIEIIYSKLNCSKSSEQSREESEFKYFKSFNSLKLFNSVSTLLDIEYTVEYTIKEIYDNKLKKIKIDRVTKNEFVENIYPIDMTQLYEGDGELINIGGIDLEGNIKIKIKIVDDTYLKNKYHIILNDLYCNIPKNQISNNKLEIDFLDGKKYNIGLDDNGWENIEAGKIYKIKNKGLCYYKDMETEEYIDFNDGLEVLRGNLYFIILL